MQGEKQRACRAPLLPLINCSCASVILQLAINVSDGVGTIVLVMMAIGEIAESNSNGADECSRHISLAVLCIFHAQKSDDWLVEKRSCEMVKTVKIVQASSPDPSRAESVKFLELLHNNINN